MIKRYIKLFLILIIIIFTINFSFEIIVFCKGVVEDAHRKKSLKTKKIMEDGVLIMSEDTLKVIKYKYPSN